MGKEGVQGSGLGLHPMGHLPNQSVAWLLPAPHESFQPQLLLIHDETNHLPGTEGP